MKKAVRKRQLVDRMFLTVELKPTSAAAPVQGCLYEVEVECTTTLIHDVVVHSKVIEGAPTGMGQNSNDIQHAFLDLLDSPVRKSSVIAWSSSTPNLVKAHAYKLSRKSDIDTGWTDDLVDPILEVMAQR